jgi:hypothetical protein
MVDRQVKTTLAEAFQAAISGVRMEMNCQNCGFMQIRMNGLEGPYSPKPGLGLRVRSHRDAQADRGNHLSILTADDYGAAHAKLSAASMLPEPLYFAVCG